MKKKSLITGIIIACVLLAAILHKNTSADLTIVTEKQGCYLDADIESDLYDYPVSKETIKGSYKKGDTFTADRYEFSVEDTDPEYSEIKILTGTFFDGSKTLTAGDIITLHEGEHIALQPPILDASITITIHLDKLRHY